MRDSRNKNNRNNDRNQDQSSKRDNRQNTSTRDMSADELLQKETKENDRLRTQVPDNYERDSE
jgi:hypothetical protein